MDAHLNQDFPQNLPIVLASRSPRRQELLRQMGIEQFTAVSPDADESYPDGLTPQETVCLISRKKAEAAAAIVDPDALVITADTMVFVGNDRLGKPRDEADALRMLRELSGRRHEVCTGVTVRRGEKSETFAVTTGVFFRKLTDEQLLSYIATGEPMDKAGSYGIQGRGAVLVERIDGDYFNVVGLPVCALSECLRGFGVRVL